MKAPVYKTYFCDKHNSLHQKSNKDQKKKKKWKMFKHINLYNILSH